MSQPSSLFVMSEAYLFLGQALCGELEPWMLPVLFPETETAEIEAGLAGEFYRVWSLTLYPYANVFLSDDGLMGGDVTEAVAAVYRRMGWQAPSAYPSDHLGVQLAALSWLSAAEAEAIADNQRAHVGQIQALRYDFLNRYVLSWLPALAVACERVQSPVYGRVMTVLLELIAADGEALARHLVMFESAPVDLPVAPDVLADEQTRLRDIAEYLTRPAWAGVFLSRDDIRRWAARYGIPSGFADRGTLLHNLMRESVNYGVFSGLMGEIVGWVDETALSLRALAQKHPVLKTGCELWAVRADQTGQMLRQLLSMA